MRSVRTLIVAPSRIRTRGRVLSALLFMKPSIVVAIGLVTAAPALAGDLKSPAFTPREMAHCMMKRVRANTSESYRDAFKACQSQFEAVRSERPTEAVVTAAARPENPKQ
jgi:hypothetical protein